MHVNKKSITTVLGTASATIRGSDSNLLHIFIQAATSSTTFDIKLTDIYGLVTFIRKDNTGDLNELLNMPCYGNWTLTIENASANEAFTYLFVFQET